MSINLEKLTKIRDEKKALSSYGVLKEEKFDIYLKDNKNIQNAS